MIKKILGIFIAAMLLFFSSQTVYAEEGQANKVREEMYDKSGAETIYNALDDEVKESLNDAGVHSAKIDENMSFKRFFYAVSEKMKEDIAAPVHAIMAILVIVILSKIADSFENEDISKIVSFVGSASCAGVILVPIIKMISSLKIITDTTSVFLLTSVPVYSGFLVAAGKIKTGASYTMMTLGTANLIPVLSSLIIIPLLNIFLALSLVSSISDVKLHKLGDGIYKFVKWLLIILVSFFTGALSLQTIISSHIDGMSERAVKMLASSAIPVIGGAIGDSLSVVLSGIDVVKSGVGAFGILASLMIFLPLLLECILWTLVSGAGEIIADLFECSQVSRFLAGGTAVIKMMMAVLISLCVVCVVSASIIITVRSAT